MRLIRPKRLILDRFSLYQAKPTIDVEFPPNVFCLAGANGLGKSTFLAALNFAITGTVPEPTREFRGVSDYYKNVRPYSESFFRGRIDAVDAENASVCAEFAVGGKTYTVRRPMFEQRALRSLHIASGDEVLCDLNDAEVDPARIHEAYAQHVIADAGFESFDQLVFLQHFVLTFDERRELIFWSERVSSAALHLAFGVDPEASMRADRLAAKVSKSDSRARNYQWNATEIRKQIKALQSAAEDNAEDADDILEQHKKLCGELEELDRSISAQRQEVVDGELSISTQTSEIGALRAEYDREWEAALGSPGDPSGHPVVAMSIAQKACVVCGTEGEERAETIQRHLDADQCPLCDAPTRFAETSQLESKRLEEIDGLLRVATERLIASRKQQADLLGRLANSEKDARTVRAALADIEAENEAVVFEESAGDGGVDKLIRRLQLQVDDLMEKKREQRRARDAARGELKEIEESLLDAWSNAEAVFVPRFTELAREFLGVDLDVSLHSRSSGPQLALTVEGNRRSDQNDLSESQRFFVDIAFRMALSEHLAKANDEPALMLIDTPEGSLDIAYEARAGSMFGLFADEGAQIVMTANINSSKLLLRLAEACGTDQMELVRMTDWAALSDVQAAEEDLFDEAFEAILTALEAGGSE